MGKRKSCTPEQRSIIYKLHQNGMSYGDIADQLECSKKMVFIALRHIKQYNTIDNVARKKRPRKTSEQVDQVIRGISKDHPKRSTTDIQRDILQKLNISISKRTISRRLAEVGLWRGDWKANQWKYVVWSDKIKLSRIVPCSRYISRVLMDEGVSVGVWGCFSWNGVGPIYEIEDDLFERQYVDILKNVLLPWAEENLPVIWQFQEDKHPDCRILKFFDENSLSVFKWSSFRLEMNPINQLWSDVKKVVRLKNIPDMSSLFTEVKSAWEAIPVDRCRRLIVSLRNRCEIAMSRSKQ